VTTRDELIDGVDAGQEDVCVPPPPAATLDDLLKAIRQLPRARRRRPEQLAYGQRVEVPATSTKAVPQPKTAVNTPDSEVEDRDYVVTVQALGLPPGFGGVAPSTTCGTLQYTIEYSQGESTYSMPGQLADLEAHTIDLCARRVTVSFQWVNYTSSVVAPATAPTPLSCFASAGATKATHDKTRPSPPNWFLGPLYDTTGPTPAQVVKAANTQITVPASGQMKALKGSLVTGTGTIWIMLLDAPTGGTAPTNGAIPLWVTDSLVAGDSFAAFDALEQAAWIYGLWVCASSTPATLTPAGATFTCDVGGG